MLFIDFKKTKEVKVFRSLGPLFLTVASVAVLMLSGCDNVKARGAENANRDYAEAQEAENPWVCTKTNIYQLAPVDIAGLRQWDYPCYMAYSYLDGTCWIRCVSGDVSVNKIIKCSEIESIEYFDPLENPEEEAYVEISEWSNSDVDTYTVNHYNLHVPADSTYRVRVEGGTVLVD